MLILCTTLFLAFAIVLGLGVLRARRRRSGSVARNRKSGFCPKIGFTRLDGMASLSLLLENGSNGHVWVEEIEIFLSGLSAEEQTTEPSLHEIHKIRQMVHSCDMLSISLCEVIYKAAGNPQRKYTCVMSSVLRYRIAENQFEKSMENYRIRMIGLKASSAHRERKPGAPIQLQERSQEFPAAATRQK